MRVAHFNFGTTWIISRNRLHIMPLEGHKRRTFYFHTISKHNSADAWLCEVRQESAPLTLCGRRSQLHLLWEKEEASASLTLSGRWGISFALWDGRGTSVTYFMRRERHQCHFGRQKRHQCHLLCETGEASASLTLGDRRGISVTYFVRRERHQRHLLYEKGGASA